MKRSGGGPSSDTGTGLATGQGPPAQRVVSAGLHQRVYDLVRQIPPGRVASYGQIAALLGHPGIARHVGYALAAAGDAWPPVPWHRVVNARGAISTRGPEQRRLLEAEGIAFSESGSVPLSRYQWRRTAG